MGSVVPVCHNIIKGLIHLFSPIKMFKPKESVYSLLNKPYIDSNQKCFLWLQRYTLIILLTQIVKKCQSQSQSQIVFHVPIQGDPCRHWCKCQYIARKYQAVFSLSSRVNTP